MRTSPSSTRGARPQGRAPRLFPTYHGVHGQNNKKNKGKAAATREGGRCLLWIPSKHPSCSASSRIGRALGGTGKKDMLLQVHGTGRTAGSISCSIHHCTGMSERPLPKSVGYSRKKTHQHSVISSCCLRSSRPSACNPVWPPASQPANPVFVRGVCGWDWGRVAHRADLGVVQCTNCPFLRTPQALAHIAFG